jgi:hypothetical protein
MFSSLFSYLLCCKYVLYTNMPLFLFYFFPEVVRLSKVTPIESLHLEHGTENSGVSWI